jgi:hypothetical protein
MRDMDNELHQVGIRIEGDTLRRLRLHQARLQVQAGTVHVTLSDAIRDLLLVAMKMAEPAP